MNPTTRVSEIMSTDVKTIQADTPLSAVRALLESHRFHHVPVLQGKVLVGILSSADLARVAIDAYVKDDDTANAYLDSFDVRSIMTPEPEVIELSNSVRQAAMILSEGAFHALPVVDAAGHLKGMLTTTDMMRFMVSQF